MPAVMACVCVDQKTALGSQFSSSTSVWIRVVGLGQLSISLAPCTRCCLEDSHADGLDREGTVLLRLSHLLRASGQASVPRRLNVKS